MEKGCPRCGRMLNENVQKCPYCGYDFKELNQLFKRYDDLKNIQIPKYAGFIKRMAANAIDYLFLFIIFTIIEAIYLYFVMPQIFTNFSFDNLLLMDTFKISIPYIVMIFVYFFYCVFMQSSKSMATLGERFVGIAVIDDLNSPLTFGLAFKRNLARILNVITCGLGCLLIIVTKQKQALNDKVTNTFVVNRVTDENYNGIPYAHLFRRLSAFIIDVIVLVGIYVLYNYAIEYINSFKVDYASILQGILFICLLIILIIYFPYLDTKRGTLGKKIMKIGVTDYNENKISLFKSFLRLFGCIIELALLPFGTLLAFVTPRKQTFKDLLTKTIVVRCD